MNTTLYDFVGLQLQGFEQDDDGVTLHFDDHMDVRLVVVDGKLVVQEA